MEDCPPAKSKAVDAHDVRGKFRQREGAHRSHSSVGARSRGAEFPLPPGALAITPSDARAMPLPQQRTCDGRQNLIANQLIPRDARQNVRAVPNQPTRLRDRNGAWLVVHFELDRWFGAYP